MKIKDFIAQKKYSSFINGSFVSPSQKTPISIDSPVEGKNWKTIFFSSKEDINRTLESSHEAFLSWKKIPSPIRGKTLKKIGNLLKENQKELAMLITQEMGKPITESEAEIEYAAGYFFWFSGEAERIYGISIPSQFENKRLHIHYEPVGVCGLITPWNFPLAIPARKIAAALAAGCTVVCKPSPETPLSLLALANLCEEAGLPPGVLNIIIGEEKEIGQQILASNLVRKISFTGSTEVGKYLFKESSTTLKKLTLELGGNAPAIVYDDANLDKAITEILAAKFRNTGQTCIAPNRIFVQESIYEDFLEKFQAKVQNLVVGDPRKETTELSMFLHPESIKKIQLHLEDAEKKGAKFLLKPKELYEPSILTEVTPKMVVFQEETFGPVCPILRFSTIEESVEMANDTPFGLAAYFFTENIQQADFSVSNLEFGIIGVNDGIPSTPQASFGGIKYSGFGREGGPTGIFEFLTEKYVSLKF